MEGVVVAGREVVQRVNYRVGRDVKAAHWVVQRDYHHLPLRFIGPIMKGWNFTGFHFFCLTLINVFWVHPRQIIKFLIAAHRT